MRTISLVGMAVGAAVLLLLRLFGREGPRHRAHRFPPPPLLTLRPPARAGVFVLPVDTAPGDSIRAILQRDFALGDWLRPLPLDSASTAAVIVHAVRTVAGMYVQLIDGRTLRIHRAQSFPLPRDPAAQRWAIHGIADALQEWITGTRGIARSRIAYVSGNTLHVVDADGESDRAVTHGGIALSPAWRHDGETIVYSDLNRAGTQIAEVDLRHGTQTTLATRGLNITPVYSPDDRWIVFGHGDDGGTSLVAVRRDSVGPRRVIAWRSGGDDASPTFDPEGQRIAFVSSHTATPQIYSINFDGSDERLETPVKVGVRSYRASPDWSPDGRTIAFEQQNGNFQVWLLSLANHIMRRVTTIGENEDPSWAPDSRHLAITSTRHGQRDIWILDVPSGRLRQLTHSGAARLAAWSPVLRETK